MNVKRATITRIDNGNTLDLGIISKAGKMDMFRKLTGNGDKVCDFLDDLGDFNFEWLTAGRVWIFTDETGSHVATLRAEIDEAATRRKREAQYRENLAAYNASIA